MNARAPLALLLLVAAATPTTAKVSPYVSGKAARREVRDHLRKLRELSRSPEPEVAYRILAAQLHAFVESERGPLFQRVALRLALEASEGLDVPEAHHIVATALDTVIEFTPNWGRRASLSYQTCMTVGYRPLRKLSRPTQIHLLLTFHRGLLRDQLVYGTFRQATTEVVLGMLGEAPAPAPKKGWFQRRRRKQPATGPLLEDQDKLGLLVALSSGLVNQPEDRWDDDRSMLDVARAMGEAGARHELRLVATQRILAAGLQRDVFQGTTRAFARGALEASRRLAPEDALDYLVKALRREVGR